jgi:hypothetical protein
MSYQILDDAGTVINTIVADQQFVEENYPNRWRYIPDPPLPPTWIISKVAMISRFTNAEYIGILTAKKTDVEVEAWYDVFNAASIVDLQDLITIDGIKFLVGKNLLTQDRANTILTTPAE